MTNLPKFLEDSQEEIQRRVDSLESSMFDSYIYDYMSEFEYDEDGKLKNSTSNFSLINKSGSVFDDMYQTIITVFLIWLGLKLTESAHVGVAHFHDIGVNASYKDVAFIEKQIGISNGKIVKGGYLWNLGMMGEIRQKFQNYLLNAISSGQKANLFMRGAKDMFISGALPSALNTFYRKYAFDSVAHILNRVSLFLADKNGMNEFLYEGGLVKDSRDFCIERAGNVYTREEGESWNDLQWRGKIPDLDFFVQVGGTNCIHSITWLNNK